MFITQLVELRRFVLQQHQYLVSELRNLVEMMATNKKQRRLPPTIPGVDHTDTADATRRQSLETASSHGKQLGAAFAAEVLSLNLHTPFTLTHRKIHVCIRCIKNYTTKCV